MVTHNEFVEGYRQGLFNLRYDISTSLNLAPKLATTFENIAMIVTSLLFTGWGTSMASVVLAIRMNNYWLLFGILTGWFGMACGAKYQYPFSKSGAGLFGALGYACVIVGHLFNMPTIFVLSLMFLIAMEATCLQYWIGKRAFVRKLIQSQEFYEMMVEKQLATVVPFIAPY